MSITEKIDSITLIPEDRMQAVLKAPKSVKIELTGKCNFRCGFCALRMREEQPTQSMWWGLFTRLAAEMREAGVEELGLFFLGEPFSDTDLLVSAIKHAKHIREFPYVFLTTNGSLAKPQIVKECMTNGLDSLKFSINWATEEQFKEVAAVKGKLFHDALANVKEARRVRNEVEKETGHRCGLYASSIAYDGEQKDKMQAVLDEHVLPFVDEHYFLPLYSMGSFATKREAELGFTPTAGNQGRLENLRQPLPCWSAFTEGHITSTGLLSACCFDALGEFVMADLTKVSFLEGWNSEKFVKLREAHLKKDVSGTICENCVAYAK
jgi:MoaA/NifB/PqqE/SkfB family radical SAM enzyme